MNIKIVIKIGPELLDTVGDPIILSGETSQSVLLDPMYATENDVLAAIMDETSPHYIEMARNIIFNASISARDKLSDKDFLRWEFTPEEVFRIRRQYTICLSIYNFAKRFHRDYAGGISKSKSIGDISVSLDIKADPVFLIAMIKDAKECADKIVEEIASDGGESGVGMATFVKGRLNIASQIKSSWRLWYPATGGNNPKTSIAANKAWVFNKKYKIGVA